MKSFFILAAVGSGIALVLAQGDALAARFTAHTIATGLSGGYQVVVADLNRDHKPDIIALASGLRELKWYENPGWQPHVLVSGINQPVNAAADDVDGDGIPEIALAHEFSNVYERSAGVVSILTHQGDPAGPWSTREIDRVPTSHRLRFVDIDGTGRRVLVNFALIGEQAVAPDYRAHVPLLMYRPGAWKRELITDADEGVVHASTRLIGTAIDTTHCSARASAASICFSSTGAAGRARRSVARQRSRHLSKGRDRMEAARHRRLDRRRPHHSCRRLRRRRPGRNHRR